MPDPSDDSHLTPLQVAKFHLQTAPKPAPESDYDAMELGVYELLQSIAASLVGILEAMQPPVYRVVSDPVVEQAAKGAWDQVRAAARPPT